MCVCVHMITHSHTHAILVARLFGQLGIKAHGHGLHVGDTGMTANLSTIGG